MNELRQKVVRLSETEPDRTGAEGVYATIRNDYAKDASGSPVYGKQFSYQMFGYQLHGPIPKEVRGGFGSEQEAGQAALSEYRDWRAGKVPPGTMVTRQEYVEMHYRQDPNLQHLNEGELAKRLKDVTNNLMTLTEGQQIGIIPMDQNGDYWNTAIIHVHEEFRLRGGIPPAHLRDLPYPNYDWPGVDKAFAAVSTMNLVPGKYLVKYSKLEFLQAALERGAIRISPASSYDDSSLNRAVRDNELELSLRPRPQLVKNAALERFSDDLKPPVPAVGPVVETLTAPTNYYVYCLASEFSLRLFADFEADACLIIMKPRIFMERLFSAVLAQLPGWTAFGVGVNYVDPVNAVKEEIDIFYSKDFSYAYQKEYRLIWKPPTQEGTLPYIHVEVGSLKDCCEIISLKD